MIPRSRMVTLRVSVSSLVSMTSAGTPEICSGTTISFSTVSLSVISSQKMPDSARKKRKIRNSLFALLNRKFLTMTKSLRPDIMPYFCSGMLLMSLNTEPLSTVMTTSRAIFTSTVFLARSMLLTVP